MSTQIIHNDIILKRGSNAIENTELVTHAKDYDHKDRDLKNHNDPSDPFELELGGSG